MKVNIILFDAVTSFVTGNPSRRRKDF